MLKVLLMTLQNAPPGLDYDRDKKFSKSFKEMVAMCLVKDQTKRPTAEKLLKHSFFKNAKPPELSVKSLLADLPPLWDRVKALQRKDAEQLALKKMPSSEQEAVSMIEYQRAVSAWNFDIEDLKIQASLIVDDENINEPMEDDGSLRNLINNKEPKEKLLSADKNSDRAESENELRVERTRCHTRSASSLSGPLIFPSRVSANSLSVAALSLLDRDSPEDMCRSNAVQIKGRFSVTSENADVVMGSLRTRSASFNDFASIPMQMPSNELSKENISMILPDSILVPHLHNFARETSFQQDHFTDLLNSMQQNDILPTFLTGIPSQTFKSENDVLAKSETTERERILLLKISDLQARMISLTNELSAARLKHTQLQQQLSTASSKRNGEEA